MRQRTFASQTEFQKYGRKSRRELFLDEMERIVPWTGLLALVRPHYVDELQKKKNRSKSSVRAKVEHPFRILKRIFGFGFDKVRYRGLTKNHQRLCANFALVNLYLHRKRLAVLG